MGPTTFPTVQMLSDGMRVQLGFYLDPTVGHEMIQVGLVANLQKVVKWLDYGILGKEAGCVLACLWLISFP